MRVEELYRLMDHPSLLTQETLPQLKGLVEKYPWFSTARMLYLKNLTGVDDFIFEDELKRQAIYITDRRKLYNYLHNQTECIPDVQVAEALPEDDPFSLIDSFLISQGTLSSFAPGAPLPVQPSVSTDYILWAYSHSPEQPEAEQEEIPAIPLKHQELIDSFLTEEENRQPGIRILPQEESGEKVPSLVLDDEAYEKTLEDSYFTETLARIYVKQKRYEKALQIIQNLNLKYPEKNIYFADQIRFLEKLIINTKK